jgi:hypothetical protein
MGMVLIAVRLWAWAAVLRVLKHVVPMPSLVRLARREPGGASAPRIVRARLEPYLQSRRRFPFRAPANCLERSLGAYRLLCEAGEDPELVVGVRRSNGGVEGHVWVTAAGKTWGERDEDLATFTRIVTFDARGRQRTAAGCEGTLAALRVR